MQAKQDNVMLLIELASAMQIKGITTAILECSPRCRAADEVPLAAPAHGNERGGLAFLGLPQSVCGSSVVG